MKIAITGSNGFIGSNLVSYFLKEGYSVIGMQRKPLNEKKNLSFLFYDLSEEIKPNELEFIDVLVHCAFAEYSDSNKDSDLINYNAAKNLISVCNESKTKIIYLSTFSAHSDAKSHYGINKFELESLFKVERNIVLRLGVVVSHTGGMFPKMVDMIKSTKILPLIDGGDQPMQLVDIRKLCEIIEKVSLYNGLYNEFDIASIDSISMSNFYSQVSLKLDIKNYKIYVPILFMQTVLVISSLLGVKLPFNRENLLGLKAMKEFETTESLNEVDVPCFSCKQVLESYFDKSNF